jgi:branched-chain amino acid transport system ATP-binding protein|uniref:ABC transporter ATP-binding protein n=1 Tax=Desulfomonile tiedjei TaxID=2358 RepID=A0A7C4EWY8_9BACT
MPILELQGVTKLFGGVAAVSDVSLSVEPNQIFGVIGPNGAGKTTLFNLISGYYRCDRGKILFNGTQINGLAPNAIVAKGIGRSFQVTSFFPEMTVWENVQAAVLVKNRLSWSLLSNSSTACGEETEAVLNQVELLDKRRAQAKTLPAGDRKKLELGIVLGTGAHFLLLDEPTCGMSPTETSATVDLIMRITEQLKLTILFTEHKIDMVMGISSHIAVLHFGTIIASGSPEEIRMNDTVQQIYFGD